MDCCIHSLTPQKPNDLSCKGSSLLVQHSLPNSSIKYSSRDRETKVLLTAGPGASTHAPKDTGVIISAQAAWPDWDAMTKAYPVL